VNVGRRPRTVIADNVAGSESIVNIIQGWTSSKLHFAEHTNSHLLVNVTTF